MATPTLSLATMGSSRKKQSNKSPKNEEKSKDSVLKTPPKVAFNSSAKKLRKFWGEEVSDDSIHSIYLKKITYSFSYDEMNSKLKIDEKSEPKSSDCVTRCDQTDETDSNNHKKNQRKTTWYDDQQSLQWETRQMRIIKAATLDHIVKYILFLTPNQQENNEMTNCSANLLEEERNNVAHAMHVLFCTYRVYHDPIELFTTIVKHMQNCCSKQFNFIVHYWLDNYPEDFRTSVHIKPNTNSVIESNSEFSSSNSDSDLSHFSELSSSTTSSDNAEKQSTIIDKLLSLPNIDERIYRKCLNIIEMKKESSPDIISTNQKSISKSSSVLELDPRFIAQQITAIDLENFLSLKPYSLLCSPRPKSKIQLMIRNFNLLSRHVIITILRAHSPYIVASHWIEVALQLRKIRNFNSLKAIIAGLTNESVYRLKQSVWTKISRASMSTFKWLSTIVDDVNNQTLLRHTQLIIEGTSKVSLEDESFGTIPYLGTFLTDITMINTRYPSYIQSQTDIKLINFEKCSQLYEILMQIQLLQKNVIAALTALQQQTQQIGRSYFPQTNRAFTPTIPRVARIFRIWFQANDIELITDKQCYDLSLALESSPIKSK